MDEMEAIRRGQLIEFLERERQCKMRAAKRHKRSRIAIRRKSAVKSPSG
jgi:hypothetical protein